MAFQRGSYSPEQANAGLFETLPNRAPAGLIEWHPTTGEPTAEQSGAGATQYPPGFGPAFLRQTGTSQHAELYTEEGQLEVVSARLVAAAQIFKTMEGHGITVAQLIRGFLLGSCGRHDMWLRQETMVGRYIKDKNSHIDMAPVVKKMLDKIRQSVRTDKRVPLALQLLSEAAGILSLLEETKADALRDLIADILRWSANAV
ncbi:hypothetical protein LTR56_007386 [Elasticomyces elasticus]|nr:hypothetical protein LTR56_007386 [Elasticomyces elasticus]